MKKASDSQIIESYKRIGNIWKVGSELNMCGQSVHQRLKKLGVKLKNQPLQPWELKRLKNCYETYWERGESPVRGLAQSLGRSYHFMVRKAREMGLTGQLRPTSSKTRGLNRERAEYWHQNNPHPKGMLGKHHTPEYSKECGRRATAWWDTATEEMKYLRKKRTVRSNRIVGAFDRTRGSWKAGWRTIGKQEKYYRSRWEANYARYLEFLKKQGEIKEWDHEPQTFWFDKIKRGCVSYLPDFRVERNDGSHYWVEVKGWMDDRSKTKIARFKKYYPHEELILIESDWFKLNGPKLRGICRPWE